MLPLLCPACQGLSSGQQPLPRDSTQHALLSIGLVLLWRLRALDKDGSPSAASLADLSHKASLFARQLDGILAASGGLRVCWLRAGGNAESHVNPTRTALQLYTPVASRTVWDGERGLTCLWSALCLWPACITTFVACHLCVLLTYHTPVLLPSACCCRG